MPFLVLGVDHTTAPLSVRERLSLDERNIRPADLPSTSPVLESATLATCNRVEVYAVADNLEAAEPVVRQWLTGGDETLAPYVRVWRDLAAAEHLFRVAAGLESQVPGEVEILTQIREALAAAQSDGTVGPELHALFRAAISCGRRARAGTALGRLDRSFAVEAVGAAERALGGLSGRSALVVGGGSIARVAAKEFGSRGLANLWIANRTAAVARRLAEETGGVAARLDDIAQIVPRVDVVVSATGASSYVITPDQLADRAEAPLLVFDLALPRDVDPAVGRLPAVDLTDLDALVPDEPAERWAGDIRTMEATIAAELHEFKAWTLTRRAAPVIAALRRHVEAVSAGELDRVAPRLAGLSESEWDAVTTLTNRLIDKMFHHLVLRLRLAAQTDASLIEAAEFLFLHGEGGLFEDASRGERQRVEGTTPQ